MLLRWMKSNMTIPLRCTNNKHTFMIIIQLWSVESKLKSLSEKKDCQQTIFYRWQTLTCTVRVGLRPPSGRGLSWGTQFARGAGAGSLLTQFIHVGAGRAHTAGACVCVVVPTQATGNWQAQAKWCNIYQSTSWPDTGPDMYKEGQKKSNKKIICRKRKKKAQSRLIFYSHLSEGLTWKWIMPSEEQRWRLPKENDPKEEQNVVDMSLNFHLFEN